MPRVIADPEQDPDGIQYDKFGNMQYHPDFHFNQGKPFTVSELEYLCKFHGFDDNRTLSYAIGKSEPSIKGVIARLKKNGMFEHYKNLNKYW